MTREEIFEKLYWKFGVDKRLVYDSIETLVREKYLDRKLEKIQEDESSQYIPRFTLSRLAINTFFSTTAMGRRAGSPLHLAAIFFMTKMMQDQFNYCIVDLGDSAGQRADILVFEPTTYRDEKDRTGYDLENWSDEIIAVEVEVDPTKHANQVVENYKKNSAKEFDVWFVVFSEKHRDYIKNILDEQGIDEKKYSTMILDSRHILKSYESYQNDDSNSSKTHLSEPEAQYLALIGESPATPQNIVSKRPASPNHVMHALASLEQKNLVVSGYSETKTKKTDLKHNAIIKSAQKKKYYELTLQGKEILQDNDDKKLEEPAKTAENYENYLPEQSDDVLLEHLKDPDFEEKQKVILILENRGYRVSMKDNKVKLYRKRT